MSFSDRGHEIEKLRLRVLHAADTQEWAEEQEARQDGAEPGNTHGEQKGDEGSSRGSESSRGAAPWPEPDPLTRELPPGEPCPLDALGSVLSGAASVLREVIQAPDAICGQSVIAGAALAV